MLPFASLTGDGDQDYFADGMVEEIVTALSRIRALFVIASGSSFSFKAKATSPQDAARSLGVRYVLTGSVRKAAGRVRISASLMDATVGGQIWADRFEGSLADVFALQDTVALSVAGVIEPAVQAAEIERVSLRPTSNMNSYDLYLRALPFYRKFTSADMVKALEFLDRAIALDADFGLALAFAARCHGQIFVYGWSDDPESHRRQGLDLVHRALKVAGDDPQVLIHLARPVMNLERDLEAATALIDRATAINPGSSEGWLMSGLVRLVSGEPDLAAEHLQTSIRLDPLSASRPRQLGGMGVARFEQERFSEAIPFFKEWAQRSDMPTSFAYLAACYGHLGQMDPGREALARYRALSKATIEELAGYQFARAEHRKLLMEGVARVERNTLTPAPADT